MIDLNLKGIKMANDNSLQALKTAFDAGYNAFFKAELNERGFFVNPSNPYPDKGLLYKEWIRGFNRGYFEQQKKTKGAA